MIVIVFLGSNILKEPSVSEITKTRVRIDMKRKAPAFSVNVLPWNHGQHCSPEGRRWPCVVRIMNMFAQVMCPTSTHISRFTAWTSVQNVLSKLGSR